MYTQSKAAVSVQVNSHDINSSKTMNFIFVLEVPLQHEWNLSNPGYCIHLRSVIFGELFVLSEWCCLSGVVWVVLSKWCCSKLQRF